MVTKIGIKTVAGTTSYTIASAAGGWDVMIGDVEKVLAANISAVGGGEYLPQLYSISDNTVRIKVRNNIEQAVNEGGTLTYTIGGEIAAGTNLSATTFVIEYEGI